MALAESGASSAERLLGSYSGERSAVAKAILDESGKLTRVAMMKAARAGISDFAQSRADTSGVARQMRRLRGSARRVAGGSRFLAATAGALACYAVPGRTLATRIVYLT